MLFVAKFRCAKFFFLSLKKVIYSFLYFLKSQYLAAAEWGEEDVLCLFDTSHAAMPSCLFYPLYIYLIHLSKAMKVMKFSPPEYIFGPWPNKQIEGRPPTQARAQLDKFLMPVRCAHYTCMLLCL